MSEMEMELKKWACTEAPEQYKKRVEQAVNAQLVMKQEEEQGDCEHLHARFRMRLR